jgi:hypothetical protein
LFLNSRHLNSWQTSSSVVELRLGLCLKYELNPRFQLLKCREISIGIFPLICLIYLLPLN